MPILMYGQETQSIFPGVYDQEAIDSLIHHYKPYNILNYSNARDYLYGTVHNQNDTVECVYSGHKLHLPKGVDPSIHLFQNGSNNGINCEHTFPRSKGADEDNGNAYSDMHHLFPTRSQVNSGRENFPYADIPDEESTHWYFENEVRNNIPFQDINAYSERVNGRFEPREEHKGNTARAMFYFYTMYRAQADQADPLFFDIQLETLCKWNKLDPVDETEQVRTTLIGQKQDGLGNPFILDNTLVDRCYCSKFTSSLDELEVPDEVIQLYPNPINANGTFVIESELDGQLEINFYSASGIKINFNPIQVQKGKNSLSISQLSKGNYFYSVIEPSSGKIVDKGVFFVL